MGLAIAAISFVGCNKVEPIDNNKDLTKDGQPFEIVAASPATKTVNDGLNTNWAANDALTVFHAEAGSTIYGSNDKFSIAAEDLTSGTFKGTLTVALESDKSYDWYAIYPYNEHYATPANTTCYQQISNNQTQNGYDSKAHLAGNKFPLVGKAVAVAGDVKPNIEMSQVCAVIKLEVTNNSGEDLTITSASVTSTKVNLAGGYFINFAGDEVVLVDENDMYMFKTVNLNVNQGEIIPNNGTAVLYLGVKPFVANDETLTISVNGYEKPLVIPAKDVKFEAGKIKKVAFSYDNTAEETDFSGEWLITGVNEDDTYAMGEYVSGSNIKAISSPISFNVEGKVMETSEIAAGKVSITKISEGVYKGMYTIQDVSGNYLYAASSSANQMKTQSEPSINAYWTITLNDGVYSIVATKSTNRNQMRFNYNGGSPIFSCYSSGQSPVSLFSYSNVIPDTTPSIQGVVAPDTVSADGDIVTVSYTIKNPVAETAISAEASAEWVNTFDYSVAGEVSFVVDENTGDARSCTVTLSYTGAEDVTFEVSQDAADSEGGEGGELKTYQHIFTAKPDTGNKIELSGVKWDITATSLNAYNSGNYAGVQIGSSSKSGEIKLTSSSAWSYNGATKVKEVRIWLNTGGSNNVTPTVTIGGVSATSDGTIVVKNSSAGTDWTKATKVTFTPGSTNTGVVVIDVTTVKPAGYICAIEIDCE